jgi:hypothetical protein
MFAHNRRACLATALRTSPCRCYGSHATDTAQLTGAAHLLCFKLGQLLLELRN